MHFMSQMRYNPATRRDEWYYRIKESFRDLAGRVRSRVMLNVGFISEPHRPEDIRDIGKCLTYMYAHQGEKDLFEGCTARCNDFVRRKTAEYWASMVNGGSIDAVSKAIEESRGKARRLIDVDTTKHTEVREIGAEWICLQAIRELELDKLLAREGWSEVRINTALAHLITRTVYTPSELRSMRIMAENSAVCALVSGDHNWQPAYRDVYKVAPSLYELKDKLKAKGETCYWTEIVRRMSTQKAVTTEATNTFGEKVQMRVCSEPTKAAAAIYAKLGYRQTPFRKIQLCSTQ